MRRIIFTFIAGIFVLTVLSVSVLAQDDSYLYQTGSGVESQSAINDNSGGSTRASRFAEQRQMAASERQQKILQLKQQEAAIRCQAISSNIDDRLSYYDENYQNRVSRYQNIATGVQKSVSAMESMGRDVEALKSDLQVLNSMILEFDGIRNSLVSKLREAQDIACNNNDSAFRNLLTEAGMLVREMRSQAIEIKEFLQTEVKPSLLALRS